MNFQHRILHQKPSELAGEQFEKYKGILNNLSGKEIILPGLMIAQHKKKAPGASAAATLQRQQAQNLTSLIGT